MSDPTCVFVLYKTPFTRHGPSPDHVIGIYTDCHVALDEMSKLEKENGDAEYSVEETPLNVLKTRFNVRVVGCA